MLKNLINFNLVSTEPNATLFEVAQLMKQHNVGSVVVIENQRPIGIITDRDIVVRCIADQVQLKDWAIRDVMTRSPRTVKETDGLFDCIQVMRDGEFRRLPVVNAQGRCVGIISFGDILAVLSKEFSTLTEATTSARELGKSAA